jgi:carbohydrate-selective porin OprB
VKLWGGWVGLRIGLRESSLACLLCVIGATSRAADGPPAPAADIAPLVRNPRCPHSANPHRRPRECNDVEFDWDETLAHGFGDLRKNLQQAGLTPTASYIGALQTNVTGGAYEVWPYAGQLSAGLLANLNKLLGLRGLSFYVGGSWGTGANLADTLDSPISTTTLYAPSYYLGEMYLQQVLLDKRVTLQIGRLAVSNGFAGLPAFANYVTMGINPTPASLTLNDSVFSGPPPGTEWGAQVSYEATSTLRIVAGIFNTSVPAANGANHGTDFTLQQGNHGALSILELDYLPDPAQDAAGSPTEITAGILHSSSVFPHLDDPEVQGSGYTAVYLMGQRMVFHPDSADSSRGATIWATVTASFDEHVSAVPLFWGAGMSYQGLFAARRADIVSAGLVHTQTSPYSASTKSGDFLELNYQWIHSAYFTIAPHLQYLWQHSGNAAVIGIQAALTL